MLGGSGFSVTSPFDGRACPIEVSLLLASDRIAYRFNGGRFHLLTGPQHEGYPLDRLVDSDAGRVWKLDGEGGHLHRQEDQAYAYANIATDLATFQDETEAEPRLHALFGDGNFAHLAWNGWPALAEIPGLGLDLENVTFVSRCDPLGDPRKLFPWLSEMTLDQWDDRPDLHRGGRFRNAVLLGANHLPARLARSIARLCRERANPRLRAAYERLDADGRRVIWLSLRRRARDCVNQIPFLGALIDRIERLGSVSLILDGFSFPDCPLPDFFHDYRHRVEEDFAALVEACPALARMIDRDQALFLNGCSLFEAIDAAGQADFYVSHGGTQQHKVGWFHPVPGVIHVPNPGDSVEQWYGAQSELALPPRCIPASAIEVDDGAACAPAERSYRINVDAGVEFVLRVLRRYGDRPFVGNSST